MRSVNYSNWLWDADTVTKASGFFRQISNFECLVSFYITMTVLSSLRGVTVKLQKQSEDILVAYEQVADVQLELELIKVNCQEEFHLLFQNIMKFAESINVSVSVPSVISRQVHRSNTPADNPEDYYRRNIMKPFLDHILLEMQERFGGIHHQKVKLLGLIPSIAVSYKCASIEEVGQLYTTDLPSPHMLNTEYRRWKEKWNSVPVKRPNFLQGALQQCDKDTFPLTFTLCF